MSFAAPPQYVEQDASGPTNARIVGLRRLTEAQYRNTIAEIFGPEINIVGRFEPILRPAHRLIATRAGAATISPAGFEQFDQMARSIAAQALNVSHRASYVPCQPIDVSKADAGCASEFLASIGRYILRHPLSADELASFTEMAAVGTWDGGTFYSGLELALGALLVSPNFLYIVENAVPDPEHPNQMHLDAYSRASRLSFLLWNTTPNEELLAAAERGALNDPIGLSRFVEHMTSSPRFEVGVRAFFSDMLLFEKFDSMSKDPVIYPNFNQKIARDMPAENRLTLDPVQKDRYGVPQLHIAFTWGENERLLIEDAATEITAMVRVTGGEPRLLTREPLMPGTAIHEMGGARMGHDPATSVLDRWNKSHEVPNLYVTDGAAMASSACQNPSLTYMALTARAANHAADQVAAHRI